MLKISVTLRGERVMGERHARYWAYVAASFLALVSLAGCTAEPTLPTPISEELSLTELGSVAQVPMLTPGPELVVLAPGESITFRTPLRNETRYLCRTGRPLQCDGLNRMRYCFCSRER